MKQLLLIFAFICLVTKSYSQPPPPCNWTIQICDATQDFYQFDLTEFATICGYEDNPDTNSFYFETSSDAANLTNPIPNPTNYTNTSLYQRIYLGRQNIANNTYFVTADVLHLNVERSITAVSPDDLINCATSEGFSEFNLRTRSDEIAGGLESSSAVFYETFEDAEQDINYISNPSFYTNTTPYMQTIYSRLVRAGSPQCYSNIVEFDLIVEDEFCEDLSVYLNSQSPPRPGFDYVINLSFENLGPGAIASGTLEFLHDPLITFIEATTTDSDIAITSIAQGISVDFTNLDNITDKEVRIVLNVPTSVPLGTLLESNATYITDANDVVSENNSRTLLEEVIGSYDPNDIMESHGENIDINSFTTSDYLFYTIRFQNVGTAEAINVSIDNTLDSQLDLSTLRILNSSHDFSFSRTNRQLTWTFENINLPAESQDEPGSHGYVHYKIKPNALFAVDDIIPNAAEIYFDFNAPVITNTFETKFVDETLFNNNFAATTFKMYPNPASSTLNISRKTIDEFNVKVYDIQGKLVLDVENKSQINLSNIKSGLYFVTISSQNDSETKKLIIK